MVTEWHGVALMLMLTATFRITSIFIQANQYGDENGRRESPLMSKASAGHFYLLRYAVRALVDRGEGTQLLAIHGLAWFRQASEASHCHCKRLDLSISYLVSGYFGEHSDI